MADHEHGTMDTTDQEKTYAGFITFTVRSCAALMVVALLLAIFAT